MSTPVQELGNPFADPLDMAASSQHSPDTGGVVTSAESTTPVASEKPKGKKRVGFTGGSENEVPPQRVSYIEASTDLPSQLSHWSPNYGSPEASGVNSPSNGHSRQGSGDMLLAPDAGKSHLPELSQQQTEQLRGAISRGLEVPRPRPAIRRGSANNKSESGDLIEHLEDGPRARSARAAFERGKQLEQDELIHSAPASRRSSPSRHGRMPSIVTSEIPLYNLSEKLEETLQQDTATFPPAQRQRKASQVEALDLVKAHIAAQDVWHHKTYATEETGSGTRSGIVTPTEDQNFMEDYQPQPQQYRGGILGALLKLYNESQTVPGGPPIHKAHTRQHSGDTSVLSSPAGSPPHSGSSTPTYGRHWFSHKKGTQSTSSLGTLVGSSASFGAPVMSGLGEQVTQRMKEQEQLKRPGLGKRTRSGGAIDALKRAHRPKSDVPFRITQHIAETIARQKYLLKLCKALMQYGAPTHRLEEYMTMSARVLETEAQFLYIPGAMIVSFEDRATHTSEVKLVKVAQGLDLGKLRDVHEIYKEVIHDKLGVGDALERLKEVNNCKPKHDRKLRLLVYGLAAACVGPFAFGARLIDLPIAFFLGCVLGFLQLYVAPASELYANVFEISAAVITSFLARAFGSIRGGHLFCFAALSQSSIALILPGYTVLCASLELQSRSIVAGSVRMVYAIIYSLFLGYGITIGTAIYGLLDKNATSQTQCTGTISEYWFFFFVPAFTLCLIIINQGKWKQTPVMMIIAFAGYIVNYFSARRFAGNTQVSNTLGALVIGVMANLYSRIGGRMENKCWDVWEEKLRPKWKAWRKSVFGWQSRSKSAKALEEGSSSRNSSIVTEAESVFKPAARRVGYGLAAAAMLPAIFVQVPSGLSVNGSLVSGIASANQITGNGTNGTTVVNATTISATYEGLNSIAFTVGYSVIQVAIGITVGLFLSAIVVYPFGKRRSGLFSF